MYRKRSPEDAQRRAGEGERHPEAAGGGAERRARPAGGAERVPAGQRAAAAVPGQRAEGGPAAEVRRALCWRPRGSRGSPLWVGMAHAPLVGAGARGPAHRLRAQGGTELECGRPGPSRALCDVAVPASSPQVHAGQQGERPEGCTAGAGGRARRGPSPAEPAGAGAAAAPAEGGPEPAGPGGERASGGALVLPCAGFRGSEGGLRVQVNP